MISRHVCLHRWRHQWEGWKVMQLIVQVADDVVRRRRRRSQSRWSEGMEEGGGGEGDGAGEDGRGGLEVVAKAGCLNFKLNTKARRSSCCAWAFLQHASFVLSVVSSHQRTPLWMTFLSVSSRLFNGSVSLWLFLYIHTIIIFKTYLYNFIFGLAFSAHVVYFPTFFYWTLFDKE